MSVRRKLRKCLVLAGFLLSVVLVVGYFGRVKEQQYRGLFHSGAVGTPPTSNLEISNDYAIGFAEFDDQGWMWDRRQQENILAELDKESKTNGLLIVTFVHGWMHNASDSDGNVQIFKTKILQPLAIIEKFISEKENRPARRVFGVYVGWRGLSESVPVIQYATFWNRKEAAERIGHGDVLGLFSELEKLKRLNNIRFSDAVSSGHRSDTKLLIIGHSFGGDIVYSAVAPILAERMVENFQNNGRAIPPESLGDLVVLINPAIEASRFEALIQIVKGHAFPAGTTCALAIFTSKGDLATKTAFPAGRIVSTVFQSHRNDEQAAANRTAIGHYEPYISFDLIRKDELNHDDKNNIVARVLALRRQMLSDSTKKNPTAQDLTFKFEHCVLEPRTNHLDARQLMIVSVDPNLIPDHSTFDRGVFTRFLSEFLAVLSASN
jgi:hypothetical protein